MNPGWYKGIYRAPDETGGGAGDEVAPTEEEAAAAAAAEAAAAAAAEATRIAAEAAQADADARLAKAVSKGIDEAITQREAAAKPAAPVQQGFVDPSSEALSALDMRDELMDEVDEIISKLPAEAKKEVRSQLRQFNTFDSLKAARDGGIHKIIANAAVGKAVIDGTYVIQTETKSAPVVTRETAYSEPTSGKVSAEYMAEVAETERILGIKFTPEMIASARKIDRL